MPTIWEIQVKPIVVYNYVVYRVRCYSQIESVM